MVVRTKDVVADFLACGWNEAFSYGGAIYLSPEKGNDELIGVFSPCLLKHHGVQIVVGVLGLLDKMAILGHVPVKRLSNALIVSAHSSNFRSLRMPPAYTPKTAVAFNWIKQIRSVVEKLPKTISELQASSGVMIDDFPVSRLLHQLPS